MGNSIKFYMDENVPLAIPAGLRRRGINVLTTQEAGKMSAPDPDQLAFSTSQGRVIFTQDHDFLTLNSEGVQHAGIAYAHQSVALGRIVQGLVFMYQILDAEDMVNRVEYL